MKMEKRDGYLLSFKLSGTGEWVPKAKMVVLAFCHDLKTDAPKFVQKKNIELLTKLVDQVNAEAKEVGGVFDFSILGPHEMDIWVDPPEASY